MPQRGFTLVEMLVVLFVIVTISAVAITVAIPATAQRRMREAARGVNGYFLGARARAATTGRPFGVLIEADPNQPQISFVLSYVEVPPPYGGESTYSYARLASDGQGNLLVRLVTVPPLVGSPVPDIGWRGTTPARDLVKPGDMIQFGYQGQFYRIIAVSDRNNSEFVIRPAITAAAVPTPGLGVDQRYKILRRPVKTSDTPFEMPEGIVLDIDRSGQGAAGIFFPQRPGNAKLDVLVLFSPSGAVSQVTQQVLDAQGNAFITRLKPRAPLFLMVGRRENVGGTLWSTINPDNVTDVETLWVGVHHQTGLVTTAENFGPGAPGANASVALARSRRLALTMQSMGGR